MKPDHIKLSLKGVEATGRYVPHAIWSYIVLRVVGWVMLVVLILATGQGAVGLAIKALPPLL